MQFLGPSTIRVQLFSFPFQNFLIMIERHSSGLTITSIIYPLAGEETGFVGECLVFIFSEMVTPPIEEPDLNRKGLSLFSCMN